MKKAIQSMHKLHRELERSKPRFIARYNDYTITQGTTNGTFYVWLEDMFVGMDSVLANAISLISLREGQAFDIEAVEMVA